MGKRFKYFFKILMPNQINHLSSNDIMIANDCLNSSQKISRSIMYIIPATGPVNLNIFSEYVLERAETRGITGFCPQKFFLKVAGFVR